MADIGSSDVEGARDPVRAAGKARPNEVSAKDSTAGLLVLPVWTGVGQYPPIIFYDEPGAGRSGKETCKERPVFRHGVTAERIGGPWDERSSEAPSTASFCCLDGIDRVEVRVWRRIRASRAGRPVAVAAEVGGLDPRHIGFERDPRIVALSTGRRSEERTLERNRRRVQSAIDVRVAVGARPIQLIWDTGKIRIGTETTNIGYETHGVIVRIGTVHVVIANQIVIGVQIVHAILDTGAKEIPEWVTASVVLDLVAVLVMSDLVGKRNVVTVSRPGVSRFFTGCGVCRVKVNCLGRAD